MRRLLRMRSFILSVSHRLSTTGRSNSAAGCALGQPECAPVLRLDRDPGRSAADRMTRSDPQFGRNRIEQVRNEVRPGDHRRMAGWYAHSATHPGGRRAHIFLHGGFHGLTDLVAPSAAQSLPWRSRLRRRIWPLGRFTLLTGSRVVPVAISSRSCSMFDNSAYRPRIE